MSNVMKATCKQVGVTPTIKWMCGMTPWLFSTRAQVNNREKVRMALITLIRFTGFPPTYIAFGYNLCFHCTFKQAYTAN